MVSDKRFILLFNSEFEPFVIYRLYRMVRPMFFSGIQCNRGEKLNEANYY